MLNVCAHIIEESSPSAPQSKTTLPSLPNPPSLSPIKRKAKGFKEETMAQSHSGSETDKAKAQTKGMYGNDVDRTISKVWVVGVVVMYAKQ